MVQPRCSPYLESNYIFNMVPENQKTLRGQYSSPGGEEADAVIVHVLEMPQSKWNKCSDVLNACESLLTFAKNILKSGTIIFIE